MKKSKIIFLLAFLMMGTLAENNAFAQVRMAVSFQTFYNELSPYGRWINHSQYGSVWSPYVDRDFQPYGTNGQWVMTEFGNTWVSDYDWGWAPFHYGRWFYDDFVGWAWVPGYEWGPAWVDWRTGGGYYGWAPLWPGIQIGVSFNIPSRYWVFVPQRYFNRPRIFGYCVPRNRIGRIYNQTTIINNYYQNDNRVYAYGPRHSEIERVTRSSVPVYKAEEVRGSRYTSNRQNADGTYRANGNSNSGLYRQDRDYTNTSPRSSRQIESGTSSQSNRTYEAGSSSRGSYESNVDPRRSRSTYESTQPAESPRSSRTYEAPSARPTYEAPASRSRGTYEAPAPSGRSGRNYESRSVPSSPRVERPATRSQSTPNYNSRSRSSSPAPSRSSTQSSERGRTSSPAVRSSRGSERSSAPSSSGTRSSTQRSSTERSRGPRE